MLAITTRHLLGKAKKMAENNETTTKRRGPGKPFQKGVSGNPGGRPKTIEEIRDLARSYTAEAMQSLLRIATSGKSESAVVAASNAILDRGWGKAPVTFGDEDRKMIRSMLGVIES